MMMPRLIKTLWDVTRCRMANSYRDISEECGASIYMIKQVIAMGGSNWLMFKTLFYYSKLMHTIIKS